MSSLDWSNIKHFTKSEFDCKCGCGFNNIDFDFVVRLAHARIIASVPFVLNSACRCEKHNKKVGGVKDSSHCKGLAVDIACNDDKRRFFIVSALISVGFKRILIYDTFIHVDIDLEKFNPILQIKK